MARKSTTADDAVFVCIEPHFCGRAGGVGEVLFPRGARVSYGSGYPQQHPQLWLKDGALDDEISAARFSLRIEPTPEPVKKPRPQKPPRRVRALETIVASHVTATATGMRIVNQGDVVAADDGFAIRFPSKFEPVKAE